MVRRRTKTWVASEGRSLAVAVEMPEGEAVGVLILVPAFGFEGEIAYRSFNSLAARAARQGFVVCLPDLSGVGDSESLVGVDDVPAAWHEDVLAVVDLGRRLVPGVPVNAVGYRLGGAIVGGLPGDVVDHRLCWEPVSGRKFVRRQRALAGMAREGESAGVGALLGIDLSTAQVDSLVGLAAPREGAADGPTIRLEPDRMVAEKISGIGPYHGETPLASLDEIVAGLRRGAARPVVEWSPRPTARLGERSGTPVEEEFVEVGPDRLPASVTRPVGADAAATVVVFTAQGSERSCGPGGLWTTEARRLAVAGHVCLRADRRGIGALSDPEAVREPNPFSAEAIDDVTAAVGYARSLGAERVVVVGSCAGAWLAMAAAGRSDVEGVLAFSVPAWSSRTSDFDSVFLDGWHGPSPALAAPSQPESSRLRDALARFPRVFGAVRVLRQVQNAVASRSVGLPVLRGVRPQTAVHIVLAGRDLRLFVSAGGRAAVRAARAGRTVRVSGLSGFDHALRTPGARQVFRDAIDDVVLAASGR